MTLRDIPLLRHNDAVTQADPLLRVLHLTAGSDAGGVSRYLHDLCLAMHRDGHKVAVAGRRGAWHDLFGSAPFEWIDAPLSGGSLGGVPALFKARRILRRWLTVNPVDVLHVHYRRPMLVARRIAWRKTTETDATQYTTTGGRIPILYTLHLSDISMRGLWGWLSDFGDHTHAAASEARQWLVDVAGVPEDHISVIPHGIDPALFPVADNATRAAARHQLNLPADATIAAFVGRFDEPKNEDWMLDLAQAAKEKRPDLNLHVVLTGGGPHEAAVRQRVARQSLEARVTVLGYVDPLPVYQACDCLMLPSLREGFSYVGVEAMSVGRPMFRTRTAGTAEMIVEGVTGRSVTIGHDAFVAGALEFVDNRAALEGMGHAAAEHVRQHLTLSRQIDETVALYHRLAQRR